MPDTLPKWHLAIAVSNEPGALARIVSLFSARGYNIESLAVAEVDPAAHVSRVSLVTTGTESKIAQIVAQIRRLIPVQKVVMLDSAGIDRFLSDVRTLVDTKKTVDSHTHHS